MRKIVSPSAPIALPLRFDCRQMATLTQKALMPNRPALKHAIKLMRVRKGG